MSSTARRGTGSALAGALAACLGAALAGPARAGEAIAPVSARRPPDAIDWLSAQPREVLEELEVARVVVLPISSAANGSAQRVEAIVLFDAPPERVLDLLTQTARHAEFRPDLDSVSVVARRDGLHIDEHHMRILFMSIHYRLLTRYDRSAQRIWWSLDPEFENDLELVEGFWELHALSGGRTLARFGTRIDLGPALPARLEEYATRQSVPKTMERVRLWVDSGGTWRP